MRITDDYIFFWKEEPMCNFTNCKIKFMYPDSTEDEAIYFTSSEQMFMYFKAMHFFDYDTADKILRSKSPEEARKLGREIKNYDDKEWNEVRVNYMKSAVSAKFFQNKDLRDALLNEKFEGRHFVEAAYYDRIWGIGYDEYSALKLDNYKNWGRNELGKILDEVREKCKELKKYINDLNLVEK